MVQITRQRYSPFLKFTTTKLKCQQDAYLTAKINAFIFIVK